MIRRCVLPGIVAGVLAVTSVVFAAAPASATFPGENGRLVYVDRVVSEFDGITAAEIYTMNPDGSDMRRLTHDADTAPTEGLDFVSESWGPKWSPDGLFIAYVHLDAWENWTIRLIDADGTFIRTIGDGFWTVGNLSWSPDGSRLAVTASMGPTEDAGLWVIAESGDDPQMIVQEPLNIADGIWGIGDPAWSPDGTTIVFSARQPSGPIIPSDRRIYAVDPDGSNLRQLPCGSDWSWDPEWFPSGDYLFCTSGSLTAPDIWVAKSSGDGTWPFVGGEGSQMDATPAPADTETLYTSRVGDSRYLESYFGGRITEFTGTDLDWQRIRRFAQPTGLVDPNTGKWYLTSLHGMVYSFYYGNPGDYPIMGDWDCDGVDTPGLYRQSDGYVYLRNTNSQGNADIRFFFGDPGDIPLAGDFNADGCDTVSIYRPSQGRVFIINELGENDGGLGAAEFDYYFGNPGDKPFPGDFDGDGVDTVGLHRESTGLVYMRNSHTQGVADLSLIYGDPDDRIIAGDWNHDGDDSPAVYRPDDRTFYLRYTNTQGNADEHFTWGQSHWLPITGNFGPP